MELLPEDMVVAGLVVTGGSLAEMEKKGDKEGRALRGTASTGPAEKTRLHE